MNLDLLANDMGVSPETAETFLNDNAISPTTQTILLSQPLRSSATSQVRRN
jgi:hypothetical protein